MKYDLLFKKKKCDYKIPKIYTTNLSHNSMTSYVISGRCIQQFCQNNNVTVFCIQTLINMTVWCIVQYIESLTIVLYPTNLDKIDNKLHEHDQRDYCIFWVILYCQNHDKSLCHYEWFPTTDVTVPDHHGNGSATFFFIIELQKNKIWCSFSIFPQTEIKTKKKKKKPIYISTGNFYISSVDSTCWPS